MNLKDTLQELALIAGFLMFNYGLYLVWPPLMFLIGGLGIMALAVYLMGKD